MLDIDPPLHLKRWMNLGPEDVLRLRTTSMAPDAQPSPSTSWFCFIANGPVCLDSPCAQSCEKCLVEVPTKLRTAVADSSVSPVPEIRTDRWKRHRNVQGVLGVHVDDLVGGGNLTF